ncbi:MAG: DNA repair protein RecN [Deltaproteobacteria bacterium]|nr:DNA repair protein RecN [Deltaproteobacteria bacterium]
MIAFLQIKNFALIDSLQLELGPGLTVLSGETGAGKSIILAAVGLLLGQRAAGDLIRQGENQAVVEALFQLTADDPVLAEVAAQGWAAEGEDSDLVVKRVVSAKGSNRVQVAGSLATLAQLAQVGPELVSVVGQHASQGLLRPEEHLALLDDFGDLAAQREEVAATVARVRALDADLARVRESLDQREERRARLEEVVAELEEAALDPAEEERLKKERRVLANAEQLARLSEEAHQGLYAAEGSVLETLGTVRGLVDNLARLDPDAQPWAERLTDAYYTLEDLAGELRDHAAGLVFDPGRLDWVEGRLHKLQRLTRKFGGGVPEALAALEQAREELAGLGRGEERLAELARERERVLGVALALARGLSAARRAAGDLLARGVEEEVADLGMAACRFEVRLEPPGGAALETPEGPLAARGLETAEFYIAPNPGEGFRRLGRIASGGELSRLLLALKCVAVRQHGAPTLVFDEVDAGIGGGTGSAVGRKLARLAQGAQVLCITHLPQIAAWADRHVAVAKEVREGRTVTTLTPLDGPARLGEMARMLAGPEGRDTASEHAQRLLEAAAREKAAM